MTFDGSIERGASPVRVVRESMGLSIRRAAEKIGCHYQTVYMAEHGMCDRLFPVVLYWIVDNSELTPYIVEDSFEVFKIRTRRATIEKYSLRTLPVESLGVPGTHPIKSLRAYLGLSTSAFCKAFCAPVAVLHRSEKSTDPSAAMLLLLEDMAVPDGILEEIRERFDLI